MSISWNTGLAAERARHNLKLKKALKDGAYKRWKKLWKQKAASDTPQASSLTNKEYRIV
jgi:hypothetical protein